MWHLFNSYVMSSQGDFLSSDEMRLKLSAHPFDLAVKGCPDDCRIELIELQADMDTKRRYSENSLVDFFKLCLQNIYQFVP